MLGHRRRNTAERGAAAVEFALIVPILAALLFGMIDYGLLFTDSVSTRNGVREAARKGVVSQFATASSCTGTTFASLKCQTKLEIGALTGTPLVKVYAPNGWVKGKPLIVCAVIPNPGVIRFVPMPSAVKSRVEMSIETEELPPSSVSASQDSYSDWSWC